MHSVAQCWRISSGKTTFRFARRAQTARRYAPPLLLLGRVCRRGFSAPASSRCSATASRLQQLRTLETAKPHDNTPTGRRSPGLFVRFDPLPSHALQGWQGGTRCGMLDDVLLYNRPRRRDEVADFVAASGRRLYAFAAVRLALCSRLPISSRLTSAQTRATADAGAELTHAGAGAEDAEGNDEQARGCEGARRARAEGEQAQGRGFTARRCARGGAGAYDIGRDGTSSGTQTGGRGRLTAARAHSCGRAQAGGCVPGVFT